MSKLFRGLITAIVTPFKDNMLDVLSLEKIIKYQIASKVEAIVVAGSTGEGSSLSKEEYQTLLRSAVQIAGDKLAIIAGCCASSTAAALELAQIASSTGIQGLLCTVPPYVKPSQEGLYQHFKIIHDSVELPIMLYSVPSRTAVDLADETILRLSELPRILALKDAGKDIERTMRLTTKLNKKFSLLSGDDEFALAHNVQGGVGCVSVISNIVPGLCKKLQDACQQGDFKAAFSIHQQLVEFCNGLFAEANPTPVKYASYFLGLCGEELRLPLAKVSEETKIKIEKVIKKFDLPVS